MDRWCVWLEAIPSFPTICRKLSSCRAFMARRFYSPSRAIRGLCLLIGMSIGPRFSRTRRRWIAKFTCAFIEAMAVKKRQQQSSRWSVILTSPFPNLEKVTASKSDIIIQQRFGIRSQHQMKLGCRRNRSLKMKMSMLPQFRSISVFNA